MEQARLFIAIGISFLIFFLWSMFFAAEPPEKNKEALQQSHPKEQVANQDGSALKSNEKTITETESLPKKSEFDPSIDRPAKKVQVETKLFKMILSEKGGAITSAVLKKYHEQVQKTSPMKELIHKEAAAGTLLSYLFEQKPQNLSQAVFSVDYHQDLLEVKDQPEQVRFQYRTPSNLTIEKIYQFYPDSYLFDLRIILKNDGEQVYQGQLGLELQNALVKGAGRYSFEGPSALINNKLEQISIKNIPEEGDVSGQIQWLGIEDRYFMTSIIPPENSQGHMKLFSDENKLGNQVVLDTGGLSPNEKRTYNFKIFMGPKSYSLLKSYNNKLDRAINFGWFDFLAKPCLWFMNFIHGYIPNYGIAIVILTVVTRAVFWPLAHKSYKSMGEMRKLQPLMQEIREKYKDDKTRMNQEMMALYRTYKVNPMGGCLPMLIQLPVFFALYRMLYSAIELRHAPFFGWITDLSAPDRLFHFSFTIPLIDKLMDPPIGIPVLTLIMGATMLIQQKMTPQAGDPTQAKIMMLMPVIFTFIFINLSSGLVLYWMVSNIFSIAQQYYTQKKTA